MRCNWVTSCLPRSRPRAASGTGGCVSLPGASFTSVLSPARLLLERSLQGLPGGGVYPKPNPGGQQLWPLTHSLVSWGTLVRPQALQTLARGPSCWLPPRSLWKWLGGVTLHPVGQQREKDTFPKATVWFRQFNVSQKTTGYPLTLAPRTHPSALRNVLGTRPVPHALLE